MRIDALLPDVALTGQRVEVAVVRNPTLLQVTCWSSLADRGVLRLDILDASDLSIDQADLDAVRVRNGCGQNILDHAVGKLSGSLVLLEDN